MKAFISYSSLDAVVANEIVDALEKNDIECFIAPRDIRTGHVYAEEIVVAIETCQVVVLVLTDNSNNSQHVLREIERAVSNNIPIISYRNEEIKLIPAMEYFLMSNQWLDNPWNGRHDELVNAVKELAKTVSPQKKDSSQVSEVSKNHAAVSRMKRKKNKWKIIAMIAIALWLISIGIFFILRNQNAKNTSGNTTGSAADGNVGNATGSTAGNDSNSGGDINEVVDLKVGDKYTFGSYMDEDIVWCVAEVEDGIATLVSENVLCMKGFAGAESGKCYFTAEGKTLGDGEFSPIEKMEAFGCNDWEKSSLRAWLNSAKANVSYIGQIPTSQVFCEGKNEYSTDCGFLNGFSAEEIAAIVVTTISTEYHNPENGEILIKNTEDLVYIPSKADLAVLEAADVKIYCEPTAAAIEDDMDYLYKNNCDQQKVTTSIWWLRDPVEDSFSALYCVSTGYNSERFDDNSVAIGGIGVRPMMRVDISKLAESK